MTAQEIWSAIVATMDDELRVQFTGDEVWILPAIETALAARDAIRAAEVEEPPIAVVDVSAPAVEAEVEEEEAEAEVEEEEEETSAGESEHTRRRLSADTGLDADMSEADYAAIRQQRLEYMSRVQAQDRIVLDIDVADDKRGTLVRLVNRLNAYFTHRGLPGINMNASSQFTAQVFNPPGGGTPIPFLARRYHLEFDPVQPDGDWEYLATIYTGLQTSLAGNLVFPRPGWRGHVPERYKNLIDSPRKCEAPECNGDHGQLKFFLLRNRRTNEFMQVGSTCVERYFKTQDGGQSVIELLETVAKLNDLERLPQMNEPKKKPKNKVKAVLDIASYVLWAMAQGDTFYNGLGSDAFKVVDLSQYKERYERYRVTDHVRDAFSWMTSRTCTEEADWNMKVLAMSLEMTNNKVATKQLFSTLRKWPGYQAARTAIQEMIAEERRQKEAERAEAERKRREEWAAAHPSRVPAAAPVAPAIPVAERLAQGESIRTAVKMYESFPPVVAHVVESKVVPTGRGDRRVTTFVRNEDTYGDRLQVWGPTSRTYEHGAEYFVSGTYSGLPSYRGVTSITVGSPTVTPVAAPTTEGPPIETRPVSEHLAETTQSFIRQFADRYGVTLTDKGIKDTVRGARALLTGTPNDTFFDTWKAFSTLKDLGVSLKKDQQGRWSVNVWIDPYEPVRGFQLPDAAPPTRRYRGGACPGCGEGDPDMNGYGSCWECGYRLR